MTLFSVIIPTYNRAAFIGKAIDSVLGQDFKDFELIVVDDGSTDETDQLLHQYGSKIRVLRQKNAGPGAARNLGAAESAGDYLAFLDSDDFWFPWTLTSYARSIESGPKVTILRGTLSYFHDELEVKRICHQPLTFESFPDYFAAGRRGHYCSSGQMAVCRNAYHQVGGFAEGRFNAEDHDLVMRLGTFSGFVAIHTPPLIACRQHENSLTKELSKTFVGTAHMLQRERSGVYPGGMSRQRDRRIILTAHSRPVTMELLRHSEVQHAWTIYRQTFKWNLSQGRLRYLAGFPICASLRKLQKAK